jgi:hypothetical protein
MDAMDEYTEQYKRVCELLIALREIDSNQLSFEERSALREVKAQVAALPKPFDEHLFKRGAASLRAIGDVLIRIIANHMI